MTKEKTIKIEVGTYSASFRQPTKFEYSKVLELEKSNLYDAMELLYDSTVIADKYKNDFEIKTVFYSKLKVEFMSFIIPDITENESTFTVTLNDKIFNIKKATREQHKQLFNESITGSAIDAIDFIFENLVENSDDINLSLMEYISLKDIPRILVFNKQLDLKKK